MKDSLSKLHPAVLITYFISQTVLTAICFHPIFLLISFFSALFYTLITIGIKPALMWLGVCAVYVLGFGLINPLINHQGETILFYLKERPITLQAVSFGMSAGLMLSSMCLWLYVMSKTINSKQYAYLLGGKFPTITLIAFISLRLIRRYADKYNQIVFSRKGMFKAESKSKRSLASLETLLTFALENGVETADSMSAKGYGSTKPTPYYSYLFTHKDYVSAALLLPAVIAVIYGISKGACKMYFYPAFFTETNSLLVIVAYLLLCIYPIAVYIWSDVKWTLIK